ncbi:MAG: PIG-L family deacetylase [Phycisphaerae bacterium]|jgi:LmbE family N-acetylglucosaminyl deacetylase
MSTLVEEPVVLAVGAHPGDAEMLCAGTLALLRQRGWRVAVASLTVGECGGGELPADTQAALRRDEGWAAAALLEGEWYCLDGGDLAVAYSDEWCRRATALIRQIRPAVVFTHGPLDPSPDHDETGRIFRQACLAAPAKNYRVAGGHNSAEPTGRRPHLYHVDPPALCDVSGRPVEPGLIVDISATFDMKTKMLARHATASPRTTGFADVEQLCDATRAWNQQRGQRIGSRFGEGFRQHRAPGYPAADLLRQVLGPLAHEIN